ncbi:MAG: S8 family serine peptidase, partial [Candidatus Riflebacteria bacterium]
MLKLTETLKPLLLFLILISSICTAESNRQIVVFRNDVLNSRQIRSFADLKAVRSRELLQNIADLNFIKKKSISRTFWLANAFAADLDQNEIDNFRQRPDIIGVFRAEEKIFPITAQKSESTNRESSVPWGIAHLKVLEAREKFGVDGASIIVGHLDSGVSNTHPALQGRIMAFKNFCNANSDTKDPFDNTGHGTHTSG